MEQECKLYSVYVARKSMLYRQRKSMCSNMECTMEGKRGHDASVE